jgi:hypothetical protein
MLRPSTARTEPSAAAIRQKGACEASQMPTLRSRAAVRAPDSVSGSMPDWHALSDATQLELSRAALAQAAAAIATQADTLAGEFDGGILRDQGGADALRLFARVLRAVHGETAMGRA